MSFPYPHTEGKEMCPNCERCDLTDNTFCNDCGYDKRFKCPDCDTILIPARVAKLPFEYRCTSCNKTLTIEHLRIVPLTAA